MWLLSEGRDFNPRTICSLHTFHATFVRFCLKMIRVIHESQLVGRLWAGHMGTFIPNFCSGSPHLDHKRTHIKYCKPRIISKACYRGWRWLTFMPHCWGSAKHFLLQEESSSLFVCKWNSRRGRWLILYFDRHLFFTKEPFDANIGPWYCPNWKSQKASSAYREYNNYSNCYPQTSQVTYAERLRSYSSGKIWTCTSPTFKTQLLCHWIALAPSMTH